MLIIKEKSSYAVCLLICGYKLLINIISFSHFVSIMVYNGLNYSWDTYLKSKWINFI